MTLSNEEIVEYIKELEQEAKALKEELLNVCWYMRGSISYDDAIMLSYDDRHIISKIIKHNLETTEKSGLPFF